MKIAVSSGKGGTGKTLIAANLARVFEQQGKNVTYLDCDVEEPNGHLFLKPQIEEEVPFSITVPTSVDSSLCKLCGRCAEVCQYNAIALVKEQVMIFPELCHDCGACTLACGPGAIQEESHSVGRLFHGHAGSIAMHYGTVNIGEATVSPRMIAEVKKSAGSGITILDSSPGTACPVVETVQDADYCVLVTDPTPFGVHDLRLAVNMCRRIGQEPGVIVNRATIKGDILDTYLQQAGLTVLGKVPDDIRLAQSYSNGKLAVDEYPEYAELFTELGRTILEQGAVPRTIGTIEPLETKYTPADEESSEKPDAENIRECVIISGKGGTGKTSLAGCFAVLAEANAIADCDVDASDLPLLLEPVNTRGGEFSGGRVYSIIASACRDCGRCLSACRFNAISIQNGCYTVDPIACEGCGVCELVCPAGATEWSDALNGHWYLSDTRQGLMAHAALGTAEENSGKLVSLVRKKAAAAAVQSDAELVLIDGSPGTGCPVIASLTGADFAVIVTEPTVSGVHDMDRVLALTKHFNIPVGVIVNKSDLNTEKTEEIQNKTIEAGAEYFGQIPYDDTITQAQMQNADQRTLVEFAPESDTAVRIRRIWGKIKACLAE